MGWLGRENKVVMEQKGRAMVFSLRDEEARLAVPEETTAEPAPKAKSNQRKTKQPKAKKARSVKSPLKQDKIQTKQSESVEEVLLH